MKRYLVVAAVAAAVVVSYLSTVMFPAEALQV